MTVNRSALQQRLLLALTDAYMEGTALPKSDETRIALANAIADGANGNYASAIDHYVKNVAINLTGVELLEIVRMFSELEATSRRLESAKAISETRAEFLKRIHDAFTNSRHRCTEDRAADGLRAVGWIGRKRGAEMESKLCEAFSEWSEAIDNGADPDKMEAELAARYGIDDFDSFQRTARRYGYRFSRKPRR